LPTRFDALIDDLQVSRESAGSNTLFDAKKTLDSAPNQEYK
jgi:hypothetical protein